jgi:serine/threonine protein kinase
MIGTILSNRYKLGAELGSGGMAWVYLAEDLSQGGQVAVKILYPQHGKDLLFVQRFNREARLSMTLSEPLPHPNIVRILNYGADRDTHYLVMEYVPGQDLAQILEQDGPLPWEEALNLAHQITSALAHAHKLDIVHRDIKPSNIMVLPDGTARVLDFGIARAQTSPHLTIAGFVGSPHYTAPEQARGQAVDIRADLYSLGIVLYRMLSGALPFRGDTPWVVVEQHVVANPLPLQDIRPNLPEPVVQLVQKAMARDPEDRFQTPDEMAQAIHALLPEQDLAPKPLPTASSAVPASLVANIDLEGIYQQAQQAIQDEHWQEAVDLFSQIIKSDPEYRDAGDQLDYVAAEMRLATLYRSAQRALETEQWDQALQQLDLIAQVDPDYKDIADLRVLVERRELSPGTGAPAGAEFPTYVPSAEDQPAPPLAPAYLDSTPPPLGGSRRRWFVLAGGLILVILLFAAGYLIYSAARQPAPTPVVEVRQSPVSTTLPTLLPSATKTIAASPTSTPLPDRITATATSSAAAPLTTPVLSPTQIRPAPSATATTTPSPSVTPTVSFTPSPVATSRPLLSGQIAFPRFHPSRGTYDTYACTVDGTECRRLASEASQPHFLPGGNRLVIHSWNPDEKGLILISRSGERIWHITNQVEAARPSVDFDGALYVYHSREESDRQPRLYRTYGADTGPIVREASVVRGQSPSWLPDGRILYSGCWLDDCGIILTRADGTHPQQVVAGASETNPEASPTGRQVAFMSKRDGNWEIYVARLDSDIAGGNPKRLTENPSNDGLPTWSPDGRHIAFVTDRDGEWAVWVMRPDGTAQRRLFDIGGPLDGKVRDAASHEIQGWVEERISWAPLP